MRKSIGIFLVVLVVTIGVLFVASARLGKELQTHTDVQATYADSLSFTNTMQWDPELLRVASGTPYYVNDWEQHISLPSPPRNSSDITKEELRILLAYKTLRTEEKKQEIVKEANLQTIEFNGRLFTDYLDVKKFPRTAAAFKRSFDDISIIILQAKQKFNRVRPSFLEPTIDPIIDIPKHPAYPSGHSTQMHFAARFLAELIPEKRDILMAQADSIAKNREIAGVHYPSDSEAGAILAEQFMKILLQNLEFQTLLEKAKEEWNTP